MTDALRKEIEEMENQEAEAVESQEDAQAQEPENKDETPKEVVQDEQVEPEGNEEQAEKNEAPNADDDLKAKQEAYKERQRKRKEDLERQKELERVQQSQTATKEEKQEASDELTNIKQELAQYRTFAQQQQQQQLMKQAERELENYEKEFKEAYPDYDDMVNRALEVSKKRMISQGYSESDANDYLRREKVMIADKAASRGEDPVEAVYKEANSIISWIDSVAEDMGYVKKDSSKPKTNLAAMKEASKPNPMGGTGKGATAARQTFDEMDDLDDIDNVTLGDLLKG